MPRGAPDEEFDQAGAGDHARERLEEFLRKRLPRDKAQADENKTQENKPDLGNENLTSTQPTKPEK
jgi:hypothetical protein